MKRVRAEPDDTVPSGTWIRVRNSESLFRNPGVYPKSLRDTDRRYTCKTRRIRDLEFHNCTGHLAS